MGILIFIMSVKSKHAFINISAFIVYNGVNFKQVGYIIFIHCMCMYFMNGDSVLWKWTYMTFLYGLPFFKF